MNPVLVHGGDIATASRLYGIDVAQWMDLSTGINPRAYPLPVIPAAAFAALPYPQAEFITAAEAYYGSRALLPVPGSQSVIQLLPQVLAPLPFLMPDIGYQEYRFHWQQQGGQVVDYPALDDAQAVQHIEQALTVNPAQHLLVIQPNNPSGLLVDNQQLLDWAKRLRQGAYLIVDEAFIDAEPQQSLLQQTPHKNLPDNVIVLRSFGKFFGLAGIRLGFVFAHELIRQVLIQRLGVWTVNGPAQCIAAKALQDVPWQQQAVQDIAEDSRFTQGLFAPVLARYTHRAIHTGLFSSYVMDKTQAQVLYQRFASKAVLLRYMDVNEQQGLVRVGRVQQGSEAAQRLQRICAELPQ